MSLIMPAYTFPREMPTLANGHHPFASAQFDPVYDQSDGATRGGSQHVINLGVDLWGMKFQSHIMEYRPAQQYLAWLQSLRGGARLFKAWNPLLRYPQSYPNGWTGLVIAGGSDPFLGVANLADIGEQLDTIDLEDLPAGFDFLVGDMVSIAFGSGLRSLHRVMIDASADGFGEVELTVEPTIPLAVTTDAEVLIEKPWCLAKVDAKSIQGPFEKGQIARVTFNAIQTY